MSKAEQYADALVRKVRAEVNADLSRYGQCRSFRDLYDVCDADTFLVEIGEKFGYPVSDPDWVLGEGEGIERDGIARVDAEVFDSEFVLGATERLVRDYISQTFPNAHEHAGCTHIEWDGFHMMFDNDDGALRLGVYTVVGGEVSEAPYIWVEFRDGATSEQIICIIDALTDLP
jgi:hypothetical protein